MSDAAELERLRRQVVAAQRDRMEDRRRLREMLVEGCEQAKASNVVALRERAAGLLHAIGVLDHMGAAQSQEPPQ